MSGDISDLKMIVEGLNRPPFNLGLTLVAFHDKNKEELFQLVNDLFAYLDPKHKIDLRDESKAQSGERMLNFLFGVLGYKPDQGAAAFSKQFMSEVEYKDAAYPLLFWMLEQLPALKKRAYLAMYLKNVDVPEEMFADKDVVSLFQEYKSQQQEFKDIHRKIDSARQGRQDPTELEKEINQLKDEREQLEGKLASLKERVSQDQKGMNDFKEILEATHSLRKQQEEESKLYMQHQEQKNKLFHAQKMEKQAQKKWRELQDSKLDVLDSQLVMTKIENKVTQGRLKNERLNRELQSSFKNFSEMQDALRVEPMMDEEVEEVEHEVSQLELEVQELQQKRDQLLADSSDGKMSFYREREVASDKKRDKLGEQLKEIEQEHREAENEVADLKEQLAQLLGVEGERPKTDAEMKTFLKELHKKTEVYKQKKTKLQAVRDEVKVLNQTQEILRSRDDNISEFNEQQEREKGVEGSAQVADDLENVSSQKQKIDQTKGEHLDEISRVVANITQTLKSRKNKLAPQIKELRTIRHKYEEVEKEYSANKKVYDNLTLGLESERIKLEQDVESNKNGIVEEESNFHLMQCLTTITQARMDQTAQELSFSVGEDRLSKEFKTYREQYEKATSDNESLAKQLRQDKVQISESHNENVEQRSKFVSLRTIMDLKRKLQQEAKKRQHEEENSILFGESGSDVNRMVIEP